jgi:hypothetical protein
MSKNNGQAVFKNNGKALRNGKPYEVGYRRPPQHTQFQPGQSGNPTGRRKGVHNLRTDVRHMLRIPIQVKEGGRSRKISTQEAVLMVVREKALKGGARALEHLLELANRFNNEPVAETASLPPNDRAILSAYEAEIAAASTSSPGLPRPEKRQRIKLEH